VTVFVNAIMYYKVKNPIAAVANVDDFSGSARLLAATTLRNVLGTMNLGDILSQRESIAREMQVDASLSRAAAALWAEFCGC
jgi:erythrocyte band 7 integral membrane protein